MLKEYLSTLANAFRLHLGTDQKINAQDFSDKVTEVYEKGKFKTIENSKYMHQSKIGLVVSANDVNDFKHNLSVNLSSKNLFDISKSRGFESQYGGINSTIVGNEITVESTVASRSGVLELGTFPKGTYTLSLNGIEDAYKIIQIGNTINNLTNLTSQTKENIITFKLSETSKLWLKNGSFKKDVICIISNIQLEIGSIATPYTPYITDVSGIQVNRYGKNIINQTELCSQYTEVESGVYSDTFGNIALASQNKRLYIPLKDYIGKRLVFSFKGKVSGDKIRAYAKINGVNTYGTWIESTEDFTQSYVVFTPQTVDDFAGITYDSVSSETACIKELQLEFGSTPTDYENFKEPQIAISNTDGTVEKFVSVSPNMVLFTSSEDIAINCQYYADIDRFIDNLMINVATSGGE